MSGGGGAEGRSSRLDQLDLTKSLTRQEERRGLDRGVLFEGWDASGKRWKLTDEDWRNRDLRDD